MATGGFSTRSASIGAYNSVYSELVITFFMFLAGCNFVLHYRALRGKPLFYFRDEEFILSCVTLVRRCCGGVYFSEQALWHRLRNIRGYDLERLRSRHSRLFLF
jgi:trk system potassium uptake protein TrkH